MRWLCKAMLTQNDRKYTASSSMSTTLHSGTGTMSPCHQPAASGLTRFPMLHQASRTAQCSPGRHTAHGPCGLLHFTIRVSVIQTGVARRSAAELEVLPDDRHSIATGFSRNARGRRKRPVCQLRSARGGRRSREKPMVLINEADPLLQQRSLRRFATSNHYLRHKMTLSIDVASSRTAPRRFVTAVDVADGAFDFAIV